MNRTPLYTVVLLVFFGACIYGAVGVWIGVGQALHGPRVPGTVVAVHCGTGRSSVCSGTFTSDDGSIRDRHVRVEGIGRAAQREHGVFVARIGNGLDGAIQSDDTVYLRGVELDTAGSVVIGVVLSVLGLGIVIPLLLIAVTVGNRVRGR